MNRGFLRSRWAAGLQAGMAGGLLLWGWMAVVTFWSKHSVWWFTNLMATTFGGDGALQPQWGRYSAAGLALHLLQYSLLGVVFARAAPPAATYGRLALTGVAVALAYYFAMYGFVWEHVNPLIPLYSPDRQILVGHIFYGFMLARLGNYERASVPATE